MYDANSTKPIRFLRCTISLTNKNLQSKAWRGNHALGYYWPYKHVAMSRSESCDKQPTTARTKHVHVAARKVIVVLTQL